LPFDKNHFVLGFVPFGVEMKVLENGDVTADLPQGNNLARIKRHGATRGCRTCNATKDSWTTDNLDLLLISRYHHLTDSQFEEIAAALTITKCKEIATSYGLCIQCSKTLVDVYKNNNNGIHAFFY
jgi:hypothetical protein